MACNELKYALDRCFKAEKEEQLRRANMDLGEKRKNEESAFMEAMGHETNFEDFLAKDKEYLKERDSAKQKKSWF